VGESVLPHWRSPGNETARLRVQARSGPIRRERVRHADDDRQVRITQWAPTATVLGTFPIGHRAYGLFPRLFAQDRW